MPWITKEGRSVQEAQDAAISASGVPSDELEIEVVSEGAKGLFGLGGEPAVVRVRPKSEPADVRGAFRDDITPAGGSTAPVGSADNDADGEDRDEDQRADTESSAEPDGLTDAETDALREQTAALGVEMVKGIIERMGLQGEVGSRIEGGKVYVEVSGEEMGILIGRSGATLEALQELLRAAVQRRLKSRQAVIVDVEGYRERKGTQRKPSGGGGGGSRRSGRRRRGRGQGQQQKS